MIRELEKVHNKYGAPMGRRSVEQGLGDEKLHLQRVRISSQGYDSGGAYWGIGQPLFWFFSDDGAIDSFLRSPSRAAAKAKIREAWPDVKFYR